MRCFVTGINGFVGSYLSRLLLEEGHRVWGTTQKGTSRECLGDMCRELKLVEAEITDPRSVGDAIKRAGPERIFHLAAQSHVPTSWQNPTLTFRINVEGTLNLIQAASRMKNKPRMLFVSSGDVYGAAHEREGRILESTPLEPLNPYAASKVSGEMLCRCYNSAGELPTVIVRPFNHIGPGQSPVFVAGDFARQIARIEARLAAPTIKVGSLDARKDFTDVRDTVRAYLLALEKCPPGQSFNISAGKSRSIGEILDALIEISGMQVKIKQEKKRLRATGSGASGADSSAFRKLTGWKPKIPLEKTLEDILQYWRETTAREGKSHRRK